MPISFPERDPETNRLTDREYLTPTELAARLHVTPRTVWAHAHADEWPHLRLGRRYYFGATDVEAIIELHRRGPVDLPRARPRLGVVIDPDDIEGVQ